MEHSTTSVKQITANRMNGKKGGVKTEIGKSISRYNATKHGVLRQSINDYEKGMYHNILIDLNEELSPVGVVEQLLVERIALSYVRLFRAAKSEGAYMEEQLGWGSKLTANTINELNNTLLRYDTAIENKLYKALHQLEYIQTKRRRNTQNSAS